jgi:serralysin
MAIRNVPGTYPTIAAAVAASASGDTVLIDASYPGNESVVVNVYNLTFSAPASVTGIVLTATGQGGGITRINTAGDSAFAVHGNALNNIAIGNAGDNVIDDGGAGNDTLNGGLGDDIIAVTGGTDSVNGGGGNDQLIVDYSAAATAVSNSGTSVTDGVSRTVTHSGIERLHIKGGSAADQFQGGSGNDIFDGGGGSDSVSYATSGAGVTINLGTGTASGGDAAGDTLTSVENVTGSAFGDSLTGDGAANSLAGLNGDDTLDGGGGADTLEGGLGNDVMNGGAGTDTASYANATAGVKVKLSMLASQNTVGAGNDTLSGVENLLGSSFADTLTGDGNANTLLGGAGNDSLIGGAGVDTMDGGEGNDAYTIDDDIVHDTGSGGMDVATTNRSTTLAIDSGIETLKGKMGSTGNLVLTGNDLANRLIGNDGDNLLRGLAGADSLFGGLGNDRLEGGLARDMLSGEAGADAFIFKAGDSAATTLGFDVVLDFLTGVDKIDLHTIGGGGLPLAAYAETTTASATFSSAMSAATAAMADGTNSVVFIAGSVDGWLFWNTDGDLHTAEQAARLNGANFLGAFEHGDLM